MSSIFYENDSEAIENCPKFHEPKWNPTGDDGEFEVKGEKIPNTVPASEPSDDADHVLGEFSSIFYEGDCGGKKCGAGSGSSKAAEEKDKKEESNNIPPKKGAQNESTSLLDSIEMI